MNTPIPDKASPKPNVLLTLELAIVAVLITWGFIHAVHPVFEVPEEYHITTMGAPQEVAYRLIDKRREIDRQNAMLVLAVFGGVLGAALTMRKGPTSLPIRLVSGLVGGGLAGACAGFVGSAAHEAFTPIVDQPTITDAIKTQVAMFATLGVGLGVLVGAMERKAKLILGGAIAGGLAGLVAGTAYPIVASLTPSASTVPLIPEEVSTRLVWLTAAAVATSLIVPFGLQQNQTVQNADKVRDTVGAKDSDTIVTS